eukprot:GHVP01061642.1.p1 GENE.GHVP01061642.1~~GHVP01061642.1.p1  ORF type:complete len:199 (+),score=40.45 GHVP01061642.1:36-632(+)
MQIFPDQFAEFLIPSAQTLAHHGNEAILSDQELLCRHTIFPAAPGLAVNTCNAPTSNHRDDKGAVQVSSVCNTQVKNSSTEISVSEQLSNYEPKSLLYSQNELPDKKKLKAELKTLKKASKELKKNLKKATKEKNGEAVENLTKVIDSYKDQEALCKLAIGEKPLETEDSKDCIRNAAVYSYWSCSALFIGLSLFVLL